MPANAFPTALEPIQPAPPDSAAATLDALADAIATLKRGLEAILNAQKSAEKCAPEPEAARSQVERCKFCSSAAHLEEDCEEADKYILAGMCKRNVFGKLTLPSGAEVPRRIKGKGLCKRFEEYHRQFPGQRAALGYLEDLARPRRPALQDATVATPSAMGAMSPGIEATASATLEAFRQPRAPERMLYDPRAVGNQQRTTEVTGDLRKNRVQFSDAPGAPKSVVRPVPGQSEPERTDAATSSVRSRMRESDFAAMAASDHEEAPLMVSQRGLFAFVPGVRSEAARAAVSTPAPPKECAMYSLQEAAPRFAQRARNIAQRAPSIAQHPRAPGSVACLPNPIYNPKSAAMAASLSLPPRASLRAPAFAAPSISLVPVEPSDRQPMTRRLEIAPQLPSRPSKPPDATRRACAMPARLASSDPATLKIPYTLSAAPSHIALAEDWGQSIFHDTQRGNITADPRASIVHPSPPSPTLPTAMPPARGPQ
ncbi:hypothetical protein EDB84DRAFT_1571118 [Lactarius hengduanensis]|nr:hypothetical protein EDB84DRAFT_1571118 [Lactarius hengduanensis]